VTPSASFANRARDGVALGDDRAMHLRPDRLRAHAAEAAAMADALARLGQAPGPAGGLVDTAVARARRELAEVEMSLRSAAAAAEAADHAAENALWQLGGRL
jgi:hypothetical protein